jgi:hypothetical protein
VFAVRAVLVVMVTLAATSATAAGATAEYDPFTTLRPATSAEKRATRPLAEAVLTAYRSGRFAPLCALFAPAEVKRVFSTLKACQEALRRTKHPCAHGCEFRVAGVMAAYLTERDRKLHRTTLAWLYTARDPRRSGKGELEIRLRRESGRWTLRSDIVEAWSS